MPTTEPVRGSAGPQRRRRPDLAFWFTPAFAVVMGLVLLLAAWAGGSPALGVALLVIMIVFALVMVLVARRSETVQGLLDRKDERIRGIDLTATAFAGLVLIIAVIVGLVVDVAAGGDGMPYAWLGAVGGVSYILAVVVLRLRG